jgi:hypothetical protein
MRFDRTTCPRIASARQARCHTPPTTHKHARRQGRHASRQAGTQAGRQARRQAGRQEGTQAGRQGTQLRGVRKSVIPMPRTLMTLFVYVVACTSGRVSRAHNNTEQPLAPVPTIETPFHVPVSGLGQACLPTSAFSLLPTIGRSCRPAAPPPPSESRDSDWSRAAAAAAAAAPAEAQRHRAVGGCWATNSAAAAAAAVAMVAAAMVSTAAAAVVTAAVAAAAATPTVGSDAYAHASASGTLGSARRCCAQTSRCSQESPASSATWRTGRMPIESQGQGLEACACVRACVCPCLNTAEHANRCCHLITPAHAVGQTPPARRRARSEHSLTQSTTASAKHERCASTRASTRQPPQSRGVE